MKIVNIYFVISFFLCRTTVSFPRNVPNLQKRKVTLHLTFSNKNLKKTLCLRISLISVTWLNLKSNGFRKASQHSKVQKYLETVTKA